MMIDPRLRRSAAHLFRPGATLGGGDSIDLADDDHHLRTVLRVRDGESVTVSDGAGTWLVCRYVAGVLVPDGEPQHVAAPPHRLCVAFAPVKGERSEWTVEKLVEIGVDVVVLLAPTARSVVRWDPERASSLAEKLRRTALAASRQSRRTWLPEVRVGVPLDQVVTGSDTVAPAAVADPEAPALGPATHTVAIGPEGGFDPTETGGAPRVGLGPRILRAETAALVAASLMVAHREG